MNNIIKYFILLFVAAGVFTSCKPGKGPFSKRDKADKDVVADTTKASTRNNTANRIGNTDAVMQANISKDKQAIINNFLPIWNRNLQYTTFSGKAKMHYEGMGQKHDFTANFRIYKDSVIWVSVSALGGVVGVARAMITPDSIFVLSILEKKAYVMAIEETDKLLPASVDYNVLQNFILGEVLSKSGKLIDASEFGGLVNLQIMDADMIQQAFYSKADSTMSSLQLIANKGKGSLAGMIHYGMYELIDKRQFSKDRTINLNSNGMLYYMTMEFNAVSFDEELSFPFSIPKSYRVNAE